MRKQQQWQILDLLQTIEEAQAAGLYADCQDGALGIIRYVESLEGEGTRTAELLAEYYELLFRADGGEIGAEVLREHLRAIGAGVRSELRPNKIEAVFLSYNASMADCLESVYLAAKADPACEAVWLPIPYFERNNDGSLGAARYEGAESYGVSFACADWRGYDMKTRRPDAIFSFAPYDADNYVTAVHPDFYFERLRGLTDCLAYIPYFVCTGDVPEHFCTVAGCVYAHKVFVQSEKVRATYIRVFREAFGDKFGKPEDKFVALGSPKYDKVINSRPEDFTLPADWRALLFKADGGKKKTVFYNTNISAILAEDEAYLQKLRAVLEVFRARAGDALLWWRPHPLNEATYRSMRPRLLGEYERITAEYKQGGWGIFDDTPDLHRAIAWSDAYFGDWSSLVTMCQRAGKPVIIQNVKLTDCTRYLPEAEAQPETERERVFRKDPATLKTESNCCYYERKAARLGDYIDSLIREGETGELSAAVARGVEIARELNAHADGTSGREIYRYVKDLILPGEAGP